jgi:hypothetical protein
LLQQIFPEQAHRFAESTYAAAAIQLLGDATKMGIAGKNSR